MTLSTTQVFWLLFAAAALSSAITLLVAHFAFRYHIAPQIEHKVDVRLKEGAARLEERLRQRFAEVLLGKPSEAIRDLAKNSLNSLLSGRRPNTSRDDDNDS
jgi:hypothetical protein